MSVEISSTAAQRYIGTSCTTNPALIEVMVRMHYSAATFESIAMR